ncbi:eCIS core domain-containing protein [Nostoc sp.]|uniref:eCIS core domain-containing protein n=1 Tax=Nostoc sp. TaxID=1180 RepID=UPI002FF7D7A0
MSDVYDGLRPRTFGRKKASTSNFSNPSLVSPTTPTLANPFRGFGLPTNNVIQTATKESTNLQEPQPADEQSLLSEAIQQRSFGHDISRISLHRPQAKLTVGEPGDKYEQEADWVANQVMRMVVPDKLKAQSVQPVQDLLQPKCADCEEEDKVQTKSSIQPDTDGRFQAGDNIESRLNSSKGGGSTLPDEVRSFMEPRFGVDFSSVRVHTDSEAVQMNQDVNAQAFTHGQDLYFGAGKAPAKDTLTAHELTHVVQQTGGREFQRQENNQGTIQKLPSWEKLASETACALMSDEHVYKLFSDFYFANQPNARQHLIHYVTGAGKDYPENVKALFGANPRIRSHIAQLINAQIASGSTTEGSIIGKGADDGQDAPIAQSDYDSEDWRNANGNIDQVDWRLIGKYDPVGYNKFQITIRDPYTWHPLEARPTQCLHEAFERLKSKSAADYITKGTAEIMLPPVSQSPDSSLESDY